MSVKSLKTGQFTAIESGWNTIVTLDNLFREVERLPGLGSDVPELKWRRQLDNTGSENCLLVFYGNSGLLHFNLQQASYNIHENFFCPPEKNCVPMVVACSTDGRVLAGLSDWKCQGTTISCMAQGEKPRFYALSLKFKTMGTALALEFDRDGKHLFLGGSTKKGEKGEAIVLVATTDRKMKEVCMILLGESDQRCVSRIAQVADSNLILAGATNMVCVIEFSNSGGFLTIISKVKGFGHSGSSM
jgi:hypothetical protein